MANTRSWSVIAAAFAALVLSACGGEVQLGDGNGGVPTPTPTGGVGDPVPAKLILLTSSSQLPSDADTVAAGVTLTAIVRDENNNVVPGVTVVFSTADSAEINVTNPAVTNENGRVAAVITTGGDPSNRSISITATTVETVTTVDAAAKASAAVTIQVIGTTIKIDGPQSVQAGAASRYVVTLLDASGEGISDVAVSVSATNGTVTPGSSTTDINGQATISYTSTTGSQATISATALGATATFPVLVSSDSFVILPLAAPASSALVPEIPLGAIQTVRVRWLRQGNPVQNRAVTLTTTRGRFEQAMPVTTNAQGEISVTLRADKGGVSTAGVATILALGNDPSTDPDSTPFATRDIEFVATVPAAVEVQGDPTVIGASQESTIQATVRDANNNLVKNATVNFSLVDSSGGALSAPSAVTDSQGRASIVYRASSTTSAQDGVKITGSVADAPASVNDTALLTVGAQALRIVLGTGNELVESADTTRYEVPYTAIVTDSAGNPAINADLSITGFPEVYLKGFYAGVPGNWVPTITAVCDNEDRNENGIMDPGEDINGNNVLDPANVASVPLRPELDENGVALFNVTYPQDRGNWIDVFRLRARARVAGTEATETVRFALPISADDQRGTGSPPGATSPFGSVGRCDLDDSQVPIIEFSSASLQGTATEGGTAAMLTVTASKVFSEDVVVPVFALGTSESACQTGEYTVPSTVTIAAGATSTTVPVTGVDDLVVEEDCEVSILLGLPISLNGIIGPRSVSTVIIADND